MLVALWILKAASVGATEPPQIRQVQPPGGSVTSDLRPLIAARFLPGEDGPPIDASSVVVLLDGVRISGISTQSGFRFAPAENLRAGTHALNIQVADEGGNTAQSETEFTIEPQEDKTPPAIEILPADKAVVSGLTREVSVSISDDGSGIDRDSVRVYLDGSEITKQMELFDGLVPVEIDPLVTEEGEETPPQVLVPSFRLSFSTDKLKDGVHTVVAVASDNQGNGASQSASFEIDTTPPELTFDVKSPIRAYDKAITLTGSSKDSDVADAEILPYTTANAEATAEDSKVQLTLDNLRVHWPVLVRVALRDRAGNLGDPVELTVERITREPESVENLRVVPGDGELQISWDPPQGPQEVDGYDVLIDGKLVAVLPSSTTSTTVTGLTNGVEVIVGVEAFNSYGSGTREELAGTPTAIPVFGAIDVLFCSPTRVELRGYVTPSCLKDVEISKLGWSITVTDDQVPPPPIIEQIDEWDDCKEPVSTIALDTSQFPDGISFKVTSSFTATLGKLQEPKKQERKFAKPKLVIRYIDGLWKPDGTFEYGYRSENGRGRIYINHDVRGDDLAPRPVWRNNTQACKFAVEILPGDMKFDKEAVRLIWSVSDPDDPSDEDDDPPISTAYDNEYRKIIDRNDWDTGEHRREPNDNTGDLDGKPYWTEVKASPLEGGNKTKLLYDKQNKAWWSGVWFNGKDHSGDNFIVKAELKLAADQPVCAETQTGVMTMWKRLNVEYAEMRTARTVDRDRLKTRLEKAFFELHFESREVPDQTPFGTNQTKFTDVLANLRTYTERNFQHLGKPGWLFLASALDFRPSFAGCIETVYPTPVKQGDGRNQTSDWGFGKAYVDARDGRDVYANISRDGTEVVVDIYADAARTIWIGRGRGPGDGSRLIEISERNQSGLCGSTRVNYQADTSTITLRLRKRGPATVRGDWAIELAEPIKKGLTLGYLQIKNPSREHVNAWSAWGINADAKTVTVSKRYGIEDPNSTAHQKGLVGSGLPQGRQYDVTLESQLGDLFPVAGIALSDEALSRKGTTKFTGHTFVFKTRNTGEYLNGTALHEFTHGLGMAHNCGQKDLQGRLFCAMNYYNHCLVDPRTIDSMGMGRWQVEPWTADVSDAGGGLCAWHIRKLREVRLEQEGPGLKLGWEDPPRP